MSARHEARRAARRAQRRPILSEHGRSLFSIDWHGYPIGTITKTPAELFPDDLGMVIVPGVAEYAEAVGEWARLAYEEADRTNDLWKPRHDGLPAGVVGAACEHIRLQTAEHFGFTDDPGLLRAFVQMPTGWLCWLAVPLNPERPTP